MRGQDMRIMGTYFLVMKILFKPSQKPRSFRPIKTYMARLYLVRHAQASFGMENYDQLSQLGYKQSAYIPKHFEDTAHHEIMAFYRGDMLRHQQTAEHSFTGKEMGIIPGLNEFNHESVLKVHRPEIADREKAMVLIVSQSDPKNLWRMSLT
jgi:broad specificity phosphatase PhoE